MGIYCLHPGSAFEECVGIADESVKTGKALTAFKKLIELQ